MQFRLMIGAGVLAGGLFLGLVGGGRATAATCTSTYPAVACTQPAVSIPDGGDGVSPSVAATGNQGLAFTGFDVGAVAAVGAVGVGGGLVLVRLSRRRA